MDRSDFAEQTIWVLAGTTEGKEAVATLADDGFRVVATTATEQGAELIKALGLDVGVESGPLEGDRMRTFIEEHKIVGIVDATHPFAVLASENARKAAEDKGVAYLRFERWGAGGSAADESGIVRVASFAEAAEKAVGYGSKIFLTVGVRHLSVFVEAAKRARVDLVARVLPWPESIGHCASLGLADSQIVAAQPPFSIEANIEHFKEYGASVVVTKDSGVSGGLTEKVEAARSLGLPIVIVDRPRHEGELVYDYDQLLATVRKWSLR